MTIVYLLTTGDGSDGDEWGVESIHSTRELAEEAKKEFEQPRFRPDGSWYCFCANIEEWIVDEVRHEH